MAIADMAPNEAMLSGLATGLRAAPPLERLELRGRLLLQSDEVADLPEPVRPKLVPKVSC